MQNRIIRKRQKRNTFYNFDFIQNGGFWLKRSEIFHHFVKNEKQEDDNNNKSRLTDKPGDKAKTRR